MAIRLRPCIDKPSIGMRPQQQSDVEVYVFIMCSQIDSIRTDYEYKFCPRT